ncbi:MAG: hypothetical protein ACD_50C00014G0004 [uncultured bacterium]|nr:MAG: hypothetical protein ACD_50C00014G0004 [uncultured bacterium]OGH45162.1 MAG: hypothetical protein A3H82_00760 [Candidatus Levybacteria bacterium RIFCSPLOWO2_02_FULL_39_26]
MKKVVYLLGVPCAGKSTIIKEWRHKGGMTLPEFTEPVPDFVHNAWLGSKEAQLNAQKWALEQNFKKDEMIRNLPYDGTLIVERSPIDAVVYARAFGGKVALWTETEVAKNNWVPGMLVLLATDYENLKERWILGRGLSREDWEHQWKPFSRALQGQYEMFKRTFSIPSIQTDTSLGETMRQLHTLAENGLTYNIESLVRPSSHRERE